MISKQTLFLLIVACSFVACNVTLSDVFKCVYQGCDDEYITCHKDSACLSAFNDLITQGKGNDKGAEMITKAAYDQFIQDKIKSVTNENLNQLYKCMKEDCHFDELYKCSNKKYYFDQCQNDQTTVQKTCKVKFGDAFKKAQSDCVVGIKCSQGDGKADALAKYELCNEQKNWKCNDESTDDSSDSENNIKAYIDCEVSSSSLKIVFSLAIAMLSLLF